MAKAGLNTLTAIPERRSSRAIANGSSAASILLTPPRAPPPIPANNTPGQCFTVPTRGRAESPIRRPVHSNPSQVPSRTFVPAILPNDLLDTPRLAHRRLSLAIHLSSPVYMGGATVEGEIHVTIDGGALESRRKQKSAISLRRLSVTLIGIESCKGRQEMFRALMCDLIDATHPPPSTMAPSHGPETSWDVQPSESTLLFRLDLPVLMGPPPYKSKEVGISYSLSTLAEFKIRGKKHFTRESQELVVLTAHDPEKALVSLPNPLLVSDMLQLSKRHSDQTVIMAAGLHRQTWISGYPVYLDIHIDNKSSKPVRKVELQLEKITLFHNYSAASTGPTSADILRLPDHMSKALVVKHELSDGFQGVRPMSQDFRTCKLELPTGLVSIGTGRFFGIRYFVNIQLSCSFNKHLKVQLPITIVHPNSIDIPPNAIAQVAASIEYKHRNDLSSTGSPYRYRAGQAFNSARRQSYLQLRKGTLGSAEMDELTRALESSPRKMAQRVEGSPMMPARRLDQSPRKFKVTRRQSAAALGTLHRSNHVRLKKQASLSNTTYLSVPRSSFDTARPLEQRVSFDRQTVRGPRSSLEGKVRRGLRDSFETGPRLQRSTSGLAFDDSDKENYPPQG